MSYPSVDQSEDAIEDSVYRQLHEVASKALRTEAEGHSLQPTLLVNDAYLRLRDQRNIALNDRSRVLAAGAKVIRRLLVDYARKRKAKRRGGTDGRGRPLDISLAGTPSQVDILDLHDALKTLASESPRAAEVVELRFFGGLTREEIAERMNVSIGTVNNDWRYAKAWLYEALESCPGGNC